MTVHLHKILDKQWLIEVQKEGYGKPNVFVSLVRDTNSSPFNPYFDSSWYIYLVKLIFVFKRYITIYNELVGDIVLCTWITLFEINVEFDALGKCY